MQPKRRDIVAATLTPGSTVSCSSVTPSFGLTTDAACDSNVSTQRLDPELESSQINADEHHDYLVTQ